MGFLAFAALAFLGCGCLIVFNISFIFVLIIFILTVDFWSCNYLISSFSFLTSVISRLIAFCIMAFISTIPSALKLLAGIFGIKLGDKLNAGKKAELSKLLLNL